MQSLEKHREAQLNATENVINLKKCTSHVKNEFPTSHKQARIEKKNDILTIWTLKQLALQGNISS